MQTISAYLLEKFDLDKNQRVARTESLHECIDRWLLKKGVKSPDESSGSFDSKTPNGDGTYTREIAVFGESYVEEVVLREKANPHQIFITKVSVVSTENRVAVHTTVSAANIGTTIALRNTTSKCPSVVRDMIRNHRDWTLGGAAVPSGRPRDYTGEDGGEDVCRIITSPHRKFPLVLVSDDEDQFVWDGLDKGLAHDLTGLAYVASIDEEAGWLLSDRLGRRHACFGGAVRLYWPNLGTTIDHVRSTVWTADRMLDAPPHVNAEERFRDQLRQRVMTAASLAIAEPTEIGEIHRAISRKKILDLQVTSTNIDQAFALATEYAEKLDAAAKENERLVDENILLKNKVENAEAQLAFLNATSDLEGQDNALEAHTADDVVDSLIQPGQIIFYKKVDSTPNHDIMVRRGDCGHNRWESVHSADKAWKGVERKENRKDWKSFLHCKRCKGGGVWKVTW